MFNIHDDKNTINDDYDDHASDDNDDDGTLLFRTGQERILRCWLAYAPPAGPRHACTCRDQVSASRVMQPFFVVYKNAGFMFQRSLCRVLVSRLVWE